MGYRGITTGIFLSLCIYIILIQRFQVAFAAPAANAVLDPAHRTHPRPIVRLQSRTNYPYNRHPENFNEFLADDDDLFDLSKRQTSDDYGHLRFGKRGEDQFDDYGHMRFGRSSSSSE